jgi:hypothetical protein
VSSPSFCTTESDRVYTELKVPCLLFLTKNGEALFFQLRPNCIHAHRARMRSTDGAGGSDHGRLPCPF